MSVSFDRKIVDGRFVSDYHQNPKQMVLGFEIMHGIGDAMVALSVIQNIVYEYQNPVVIFFCCLDNGVKISDLLEIFDVRCDKIVECNKLQQFISDGREIFSMMNFQNRKFFSFWDILNFNCGSKIDQISLKISPSDLSKQELGKYSEIVSVQPYTHNKESYAKIETKIEFIKNRWNDVFDSNQNSLFLLLGSEKDKNIGFFEQKNVVSFIGQTNLRESCEIILACDRHMAIESWSQIFCHVVGKPNVQFWDFNVFEIYKYMIEE